MVSPADLPVQVSLNQEAVKAALKVVYHLAKKEIPHHTNFKDLVKFATTELGKEYPYFE